MTTLLTAPLLDFHVALFERIFTQPLTLRVKDPLRLRAVRRQIEDAADAASTWLGRFFKQHKLDAKTGQAMLKGLLPLSEMVTLAELGNPNILAEILGQRVLLQLPLPKVVQQTRREVEFSAAAHGLIQALSIVAPVLLEWQRARFAATFEPVRRIVLRLNQTSAQIDAFASANRNSNADERFELSFRDHLLQRFFKVDVGMIRSAGALHADLRALWVMPTVGPVRGPIRRHDKLLDTVAARQALQPRPIKALPMPVAELQRTGLAEWLDGDVAEAFDAAQAQPVLDAVLGQSRLVLVGAPGSGKSTLLEWLHIQVAGAELALIGNDQQAIPLLLRVRELQPAALQGQGEHPIDGLMAYAPGGAQLAALMPSGWLARQMQAGRVLLLLDGLDECEPAWRDGRFLPWLRDVLGRFPDNRVVITTRPIAYAPETLLGMGFAERELRDFDTDQSTQYVRQWCAAIGADKTDLAARLLAALADNETVRGLARNPLLLSALCLAAYFDGSTPGVVLNYPALYQTCVEGLLHHWDVRRGIRSAFGLDEKLRVCREVACAMQHDDRAEYTSTQVQRVIEATLQDKPRAAKLLQHLRQRSGLLLEQRPGVFAFAHLSFQEYLANR